MSPPNCTPSRYETARPERSEVLYPIYLPRLRCAASLSPLRLEPPQDGVEVRHGVRRIGRKRQAPSPRGHQPRQGFVQRGAEPRTAEAQSFLKECLHLCRGRGPAGSRAALPLEQAYAHTRRDGHSAPRRWPRGRQLYDQFLVPVRQERGRSTGELRKMSAGRREQMDPVGYAPQPELWFELNIGSVVREHPQPVAMGLIGER